MGVVAGPIFFLTHDTMPSLHATTTSSKAGLA